MRRDIRGLTLLVVLALLAAACGARVSSSVRNQAISDFQGNGAAVTGSGTGAGGVATLGGTSTGQTRTGVRGSTGVRSTGGGSTAGRSTGGTVTGGSVTGGSVTGTGRAASNNSNCPTLGQDVGLSGNTISIGTVASETGPVNGLFNGAIEGMQAFASYIDSTGGICGYMLKVDTADDGTNCTQNEAATSALGAKDFALVGSFSLYDNCGEPYIAQNNIPDLHDALSAQALTPASHFDLEPGNGYATGMFAYYAQKLGSSIQHVGTLVEGIPSAEAKQQQMVQAAENQGWHFDYTRTVAPTESDWTQDFVKMCDQSHIKVFFEVTEDAEYAAKMVNDEQQAGCQGVVNIIPVAYDQAFINDVGSASAANGVMGWNEYSLFFNQDEAANIPELNLLQGSFARVFPGAPLNLYALFAWSEGRLLQYGIEHAGKVLTRASLIAALSKVTNFSANGIVAPTTPSSKTTGNTCYITWQINNGVFQRVDDPSAGYRCDGSFMGG